MDIYAAYYCFVNFGMTPGQYDVLDDREKLLIIGFIEVYLDAQKKAQEEARR